jgi:hypothetical protein
VHGFVALTAILMWRRDVARQCSIQAQGHGILCAVANSSRAAGDPGRLRFEACGHVEWGFGRLLSSGQGTILEVLPLWAFWEMNMTLYWI